MGSYKILKLNQIIQNHLAKNIINFIPTSEFKEVQVNSLLKLANFIDELKFDLKYKNEIETTKQPIINRDEKTNPGF
jgi:hypothetical protein